MRQNLRQNLRMLSPFVKLLLVGAVFLCGAWLVGNWPAPAEAQTSREIRVVSATAAPGQNVTVALELVAQGDENAVGFSLNFSPALLTYQGAALGSGVPAGATFFTNPNAAASGRVGLTLALPTEQKFQAGVRQLLTVNFSVAASASGSTQLSFGDDPARRDVSDINGNSLDSNYTAGTLTFAQNNPVPTLASLSPTSREAGSGAFTLTVNGTNFVNGAVVRWQGSDRATTFVSATQLTAQILAADVANAGTASVTVFNPLPGGGVSNAASLAITATTNNPVPTITSLEPSSRAAGTSPFTLAINGSNFINLSSVRWNGSDRLTAFINATRLTIEVSAADLAAPGAAVITVFNPAPGGGLSNGVTFTVTQPPNPVPTITSLNPSSITAGSGAFTLTLNGSNFVNGAVVRWQGSDRTTTFVSASQLTAAIPAADIASAGTATITVFNPLSTGGGGGLSNAVTFTINVPPNPVPTLTSLNPSSATAGGAAFTLTVNGSNFVNGATVRWKGSDRTTTLVSATQLTAAISAADIASAGTAAVTVFNPASVNGGGGASNSLNFTINPPPNPVPTLASLNPNNATAGGAAFTLTLNGSNFVNGAAVRWNGGERATTFVSATQLTAQILAADIATTGTASVTVFNPASSTGGGGTSNALTFTINPQPNPTPVISSLNPNTANAGASGFTLIVQGSGFLNSSLVRWNGADRVTSFVSATQLNATIPASDLASVGTANVTVFNPSPGGGVSNAVGFSIGAPPNPVAALTSLSPASVQVGSGALTLTVNGSNFVNGAVVRFNGADRATTFVSSSQVRANLSAADVATAGSFSVTVFNPAPGGGVSNALSFAVNLPPNPTPTLSGLTPNPVIAGSGAFTLTVNGSNFVSGAVVRWQGSDRVTTFVSATQLTAAIPAADIAATGTASVTVFNPANASGGGGLSNALTVTINPPPNPAPTLSALQPNQLSVGSAAFTLTLTGANFLSNSVVRWNGSDRVTTFVSATQLTAAIPASDLATGATISVTVFNPANVSGGGGASNALSFAVNNPIPTLSAIAPTSAVVNSPAFTLTVTGTNFVAGSVVRWNGENRATTFVSATQLTAQILASDLATASIVRVTVFNPAPGGGASGGVNFTVQGNVPTPALTALNPNALAAGGAAFTLTVTGTGFVSNSVVRWQGSDRATTLVSATQLTAQITAADIPSAGTASVTVFNPAPANAGGGTSNALLFTINPPANPVPVLASLNPTSVSAGSAAFTLTVNGSNFVSGATVRWNGASRPTTFLSSTQLAAQLPASDVATAGTAQITVFNPASSSGGGGASNALTFTINPPVNPTPTLSSLNPSFAFAGGAAFTLTVTGTNFVSASVVRWNGAERATTLVSATQLRASIPAADIANAGSAQVTVFNPVSAGADGGASNALSFAIAGPLANVSAASFTGNELAAEMIVASFGLNLATGIELANSLPLPTSLRGTSVRVRDSAGVERLAPLFFVAPSQVNYLLPAGLAPGAATVSITSGDNKLSASVVTIASVAPGLFTANSNGQGVPAGGLLRVRGDGSQSFEPISTTSPSGQQAPLPLDLGPASDQVFLVLFGTGFRGVSSPMNASATLGGTTAEVLFAGAQGTLAGLDQTNIRIPRSLAGRGEVDLVFRVDGKAANTVKINVK